MLFPENEQIIQKDGSLTYCPNFLDLGQANRFFEALLHQVQWEQYYIQLFGKKVAQPRLTAWYGETGAAYSYSGISLEPIPFSPELLYIKKGVEAFTGKTFNSVLLNLYRHNQDSMGWHSDDEKELGPSPFIASVSLGAPRMFHVKHKIDKSLKGKLFLTHGSLLCMGGVMQEFWQHAVPKSAVPCKERINLTFRLIMPN